jgi:hypothetical protein
MCKRSGETPGHLLHCDVTRDLWIMVFQMFGVEWVMPKRMVDLLTCWKRMVGQNDSNIVWNVISSFLMWCIWREKTLEALMTMRERARINKLVFLNPYLSESLLISFPMSLAFLIFLHFLLILDLLGVLFYLLHVYLGAWLHF